MWRTLNYEKPKSLAGGEFYSPYGEYNVHMMGGDIKRFFKKVTSNIFHIFTFFEFSFLHC